MISPQTLRESRSLVAESQPTPKGKKPIEWLLAKIAIIALAAGFVYAPAFHGDWLWDDDQEIWQNAILKDEQGLVKIWDPTIITRVMGTALDKWFHGKDPDPQLFKQGEYRPTDYFPLKASFQWILYRFWGDNKTGWHVTNTVLHICGALLVWMLLQRFLPRAAWWGGLLFAIHPICVESVAWISELKNTLSLPFMLLSMIAFIDFERKRRVRLYLLSLLAYLAAILSKTSVVMLPVVLLLYLWWENRNTPITFAANPVIDGATFMKRVSAGFGRLWSLWPVRAVLLSAPFFFISLLLGIITIAFQHANAIAAEKIPVGDMVSRTATAGMAILFYFSKCVFPVGLNVIYPRWEVDPPQWYQFLPWPILFIVFVWLWLNRKTWGSHVLLGLGFFVINLVPVLGFVTMSYMRITWVADHFVYISVIGIIGLIVAGGSALYLKLRDESKTLLTVTAAAAALVMTLFSHGYANIFVDEDALWTYTLKRNPNAWQAHNRLGAKKFARGEVDAALYHFQNSSRLRPDLGETHNNLGAALMQLGRRDEAIEAFEKALKATPHIVATQANLANAYAHAGRLEEAERLFRRLVDQQPGNPVFQGNLGAVLLQLGRREEAVYHLLRSYEMNPNLQGIKENLERAGVTLPTQGAGRPLQLQGP